MLSRWTPMAASVTAAILRPGCPVVGVIGGGGGLSFGSGGRIRAIASVSNAGRFAVRRDLPTSGFLSRDFGLQRRRFESARVRADAGSPGGRADGSGGGNSGSGGAGFGSGGGRAGDADGGNDSSPFSWYLSALDKHPIITKAITSALLTLVGDLICQFVIDQASKLDVKRTFVFTFLGLALVGPTLHVWYLYLSKLVTIKNASGAVVVRLLLDQFVFSPIFIGVFMALVVTLEGNPSIVVPKLRQDWYPSIIANWQLWIPFQFLNFYFVPQKLQVLAANVVALAWNVILSIKAHKEVIVR